MRSKALLSALVAAAMATVAGVAFIGGSADAGPPTKPDLLIS